MIGMAASTAGTIVAAITMREKAAIVKLVSIDYTVE
jgi:hypothetical protein